jgi:hypothetical protein
MYQKHETKYKAWETQQDAKFKERTFHVHFFIVLSVKNLQWFQVSNFVKRHNFQTVFGH